MFIDIHTEQSSCQDVWCFCFFILQTIYHLNPTNSVHRDVSTTTSKIETKTLISDVVIVLNSSVTVIINYKQLGKKARLSN